MMDLNEYKKNYILFKYANDEAFRKKQDDYVKIHHRNKYMNDDEYREKVKLKNRDYYDKMKETEDYKMKHREYLYNRYTNDDEFREKVKLRNRENYAKKKALQQQLANN